MEYILVVLVAILVAALGVAIWFVVMMSGEIEKFRIKSREDQRKMDEMYYATERLKDSMKRKEYVVRKHRQ